jgi:hypothetical protein
MTSGAARVGLDLLLAAPLALIVIVMAGTRRRRIRQRAMNAPLRAEITADVVFETRLDHVSHVGEGGFGGTSGYWIELWGPARLVVGTGAFMVSTSMNEFVFRGAESSITVSQEPSRVVSRDYVIIAGGDGERRHEVAISRNTDLQEIWTALLGAGASPGPPSS